METFVIGHLSDLHFSQGASETSPHKHSIPHLRLIQNALANRALDKLIVSGDLTNVGDKESLLRVRDWLFRDFSISAAERLGLNKPESLVRVVPGNHDAYNAGRSPGDSYKRWQKSIKNYMEVFPNPRAICGCDYDWLEKDNGALYIAYVDSCFLGDPTLRNIPEIRSTLLESISKPARGKLSLQQSKQLLTWFDFGMAGNLNDPNNEEAKIPKEKFAKSFKILVMHHYLFEPAGFPDDVFLRIQHRDTVFRNIALADFDMYLCGHKHVSDFSPHFYGHYFDRRAKGRYLLNLFRRRLGANTLPFQFRDSDGRVVSNWINRLLEVLIVKLKTESVDESKFIDTLMDMLRACIANPAKCGAAIEEFVKAHKLAGLDLMDEESVQEIQSQLITRLTKQEREVLAKTGLVYISRIVKSLNSRPFIQSMCGSSAKASTEPDSQRSFNIYSFEFDEKSYVVKRTRFDIDLDSVNARTDEFAFSSREYVHFRQV